MINISAIVMDLSKKNIFRADFNNFPEMEKAMFDKVKSLNQKGITCCVKIYIEYDGDNYIMYLGKNGRQDDQYWFK